MDYLQLISDTFPTADKEYAEECALEDRREEMLEQLKTAAVEILGCPDWMDFLDVDERQYQFLIDFKGPSGNHLWISCETPEALCQAIIDSGFFAAELEG